METKQELVIRQGKEKGELLGELPEKLQVVLPEDLIQLPTLFKSFLDKQAVLAEPSAKLAEVQVENDNLKARVAELSSPEYLKSRLANLDEDTYLRLGQELGFLEAKNETQGKRLEEKDTSAEAAQATGSVQTTASGSKRLRLVRVRGLEDA